MLFHTWEKDECYLHIESLLTAPAISQWSVHNRNQLWWKEWFMTPGLTNPFILQLTSNTPFVTHRHRDKQHCDNFQRKIFQKKAFLISVNLQVSWYLIYIMKIIKVWHIRYKIHPIDKYPTLPLLQNIMTLFSLTKWALEHAMPFIFKLGLRSWIILNFLPCCQKYNLNPTP